MELDFEPSLRYIVYTALYNIYILLIRIHFNNFFFFVAHFPFLGKAESTSCLLCKRTQSTREKPQKGFRRRFLSFIHFVSLFYNPFQPFQLLIFIFTSSQISNLVPIFLHYSFKLNRKSSRLQ